MRACQSLFCTFEVAGPSLEFLPRVVGRPAPETSPRENNLDLSNQTTDNPFMGLFILLFLIFYKLD